jgi:UDP-glucose 4-epimerase
MHDIVIHGASGFLGKHFVRKLIAEKIPVHIIARHSSSISEFENKNFVSISRYEKSISEIDPHKIAVSTPVFFDFAWYGVFGTERNDERQLSVNIPMTEASLKLASVLKSKHWIGVGSQAEYGNLDKKISEQDECHPTTLYGKAKLACAGLSERLCKEYGMEHSWLRLFSVYGPDDNHEWLIQYLITEMLNDREINVTKGEQCWDYLYIDDVSEMFYKLKDARGAGIANLGSGKSMPVRDIILTIKKITQSNSKINFGAVPYRPDQVMLMEADITKLSTHLNWQPVTGMEEGLRRTIEFIKKGSAVKPVS